MQLNIGSRKRNESRNLWQYASFAAGQFFPKFWRCNLIDCSKKHVESKPNFLDFAREADVVYFHINVGKLSWADFTVGRANARLGSMLLVRPEPKMDF